MYPKHRCFLFGLMHTCKRFHKILVLKSYCVWGNSSFDPFHSGYLQTGTLANSEDPDEKLYNAAFHQGLHCLQ